jgi:hypothetical protein
MNLLNITIEGLGSFWSSEFCKSVFFDRYWSN